MPDGHVVQRQLGAFVGLDSHGVAGILGRLGLQGAVADDKLRALYQNSGAKLPVRAEDERVIAQIQGEILVDHKGARYCDSILSQLDRVARLRRLDGLCQRICFNSFAAAVRDKGNRPVGQRRKGREAQEHGNSQKHSQKKLSCFHDGSPFLPVEITA